MADSGKITYFAETDARNKRVKFGIKEEDRLRHVYSIGKTGMGKSTMLENMAIQDIQNGNGMAFLDPHGKTADLLLGYIPENRIKDVIYFAPFDTDFPISFNVMEDVGPMKRHLVLAGLMSAFEKVFGEESFSDRMQYILQNTILALLEYPNATMLGINKMLSDKAYRNDVIAHVTDLSVKNYWTKEFAGYTDRFAADAIPAIQNKIGQFTSNPLIRNIIGQPKSSFDIRKLMDDRKILIVNLSKGLVGESNANLLGSMLVTKMYLAAMSRADASPSELKKLPNFYLYVDEFQSFANKSFADILSEARKYKLSLNITHQYIEQMSEEVRAAVFGNVGTLISFRVGSFDAEILEKEFAPVFTMEDIVNLGFAQIYLKLMIDNVASSPFSATTLPPIKVPEISFKEEVLDFSRKNFSTPKDKVEEAIRKWHEAEIAPSPKPQGEFKKEKGEDTRKEHSLPQPAVQKPSYQSAAPVERVDRNIQIQEKQIERPAPQPISQKPEESPLAKALKDAVKERQEVKAQIPRELPKREEPAEKISLNQLRHGDKNINKGATPEHKNALKDALSKIQTSPIQEKKVTPTETQPKPVSQLSNLKKEEKAEKPKEEPIKKANEVPKEVLEKILNS